MACDPPVLPPSIASTKMICTEMEFADRERLGILESCQKVFAEWSRLRAAYDECRRGEDGARLKKSIDDAAGSISPPR